MNGTGNEVMETSSGDPAPPTTRLNTSAAEFTPSFASAPVEGRGGGTREPMKKAAPRAERRGEVGNNGGVRGAKGAGRGGVKGERRGGGKRKGAAHGEDADMQRAIELSLKDSARARRSEARAAGRTEGGKASRGRGGGRDSRDEAPYRVASAPDAMSRSPGDARSLNHLLNFHYTESTRGSGSTRLPGAVGRRSKPATPYSSERFMQANFKFVVPEKLGGSHLCEIDDVDKMVSWSEIVQVSIECSIECPIECSIECPMDFPSNAPSNVQPNALQVVHTSASEVSCPVCLEPPVAPKITKCGHIYCWACFLRFLDTQEKGWGRCPICHQAFSSTIRAIIALHQYVNGDDS